MDTNLKQKGLNFADGKNVISLASGGFIRSNFDIIFIHFNALYAPYEVAVPMRIPPAKYNHLCRGDVFFSESTSILISLSFCIINKSST